jgi:hypothetical protein
LPYPAGITAGGATVATINGTLDPSGGIVLGSSDIYNVYIDFMPEDNITDTPTSIIKKKRGRRKAKPVQIPHFWIQYGNFTLDFK